MGTNLTKEEIISRIGFFRNKKQFSAYELSLRLGHSKNYMYRIEKGQAPLTIDLLLEILDILEVSTSEFFYGDYKNYQKDKQDFDFLKSLSDEEINALKVLFKNKK